MKESNLTGKWKVSDLKKNKNWLFELDTDDQKELVAATNLALTSVSYTHLTLPTKRIV